MKTTQTEKLPPKIFWLLNGAVSGLISLLAGYILARSQFKPLLFKGGGFLGAGIFLSAFSALTFIFKAIRKS